MVYWYLVERETNKEIKKMNRVTLDQAIEQMKDNWTGKMIFAQNGKSEVNIYRGLNMTTFERTGICIDIVSYSETDHGAALMFVRKLGLNIYSDAVVLDEKGRPGFYTLNAGQDTVVD